MRRTVMFFVAASLLTPLTPVSAQRLPRIAVGERVRVEYACKTRPVANGNRIDCTRNTGALVAVSADTITLLAADTVSEMSFALDSVRKLDVQRGRQTNGRSGVLLGGLAGFVVGIPVGLIEREDYACAENSWVPCGGAWDPLVAIPIMFGVAGGLLGGGIGNLIKTDRWEEVPLDRLRVSFAPQRDGFALGISVAF